MSTEDGVRDVLSRVTGLIPNEQLAGVLFAAGLILADHALNILGGVQRWLQT